MSDVVNKLWGYCHTLRHEGIDYADYVEQITYLLFLKMADERGRDELAHLVTTDMQGVEKMTDARWTYLVGLSGTALAEAYEAALAALGRQTGILGDIFAGAQNRIAAPASLKKLMGAIDAEAWTEMDVDVKAAIFEGLLEKAASEGKKGAGQYFTPRLLIQAIVQCLRPDPRAHPAFTIGDPACGTGGFLVEAYDWFKGETGGALDVDLARRVKTRTYYGQELVQRPRRLALMNLWLHGVEPHIALGDSIYHDYTGPQFDVVLANPPFGTRGGGNAPDREDFVVETSNKQLNFLQHILTILKPGGRAAVVVPDNCLFADQAGEVFKLITESADLHTVVRLPRGTFTPYSPGTKTYVVFFRKGPKTERTWLYDARAGVPGITKKSRPLTAAHFSGFVDCYGADPNGTSARSEADSPEGRWKAFPIEQIREAGFKIDAFKWLRDDDAEDPADLPEPEELATDAIAELEGAVEELNAMLRLLEGPEAVAEA